jgi:hypothetical protein
VDPRASLDISEKRKISFTYCGGLNPGPSSRPKNWTQSQSSSSFVDSPSLRPPSPLHISLHPLPFPTFCPIHLSTVFTQISVLTSLTTDWQFGMDKGQSALLEASTTGGRVIQRLWHHDPWNFLLWPQQQLYIVTLFRNR